MTDDTDPGDADRAVSLPLIDTFAALSAELDAKTDRIERLESELDRTYLDSDDAGLEGTNDENSTDDAAPRTHEDWEPATDPLDDTGVAAADGDHEGVTPAVDPTNEADPAKEPAATDEPTDDGATSADASASGLSPVRTASTDDPEPAVEESNDPASAAHAEEADEAFGVTMEASSDLTGGSLASSAGTSEAASEGPDRERADDAEAGALPDPTADRGERLSRLVHRAELRDEDAVVETFVRGIDALDEVTREMLAHYREVGDAAPVDAHVAAGGSGERQYAYARNRTLRKAGVIEHDGAGRYRYALPELVAEAFDGNAAEGTVGDALAAIEAATDLA